MTKSTCDLSENLRAARAYSTQAMRHTLEQAQAVELELSRLIATQSRFAELATKNSIELEKKHFLRTWIKSTSWQENCGNTAETIKGQRNF